MNLPGKSSNGSNELLTRRRLCVKIGKNLNWRHLVRKILNSPVLVLLVLLATCAAAQAQNMLGQSGSRTAQSAVANPTSITTNPTNQGVVGSLSSLPEA